MLQRIPNRFEMSIVRRLKPTDVDAAFVHVYEVPQGCRFVHILRKVKIRLNELKKIIRSILIEDYNSPTIPADVDPSEQQFKNAYPKWGNPQPKELKRKTPAEAKTKQVIDILAQRGLTKNAVHMKKITQELLPFIEAMNPSSLFIADPSEIADDFSEQVLNTSNLGTSLEGTSHHLFPVPVFGWDKLQVLFLDG